MTIAGGIILCKLPTFVQVADVSHQLLFLSKADENKISEHIVAEGFIPTLNDVTVESDNTTFKAELSPHVCCQTRADVVKLPIDDDQGLTSKKKTGGQIYRCDVQNCGRTFASVGYMKYHKAVHNGQRSLKCKFEGCNRNFLWPAHLKYHLMTHNGSRLFKCPVSGCDKSFYTSQRLRVHKRTHTGEKPYKCGEEGCERSFTTAGNLKNHSRVHTGDRPFVCEVDDCRKCFAEQSSLKKHLLVHTGEKPYTCKVCGRSFSQSGSRNVHIKRRHQNDTTETMTDINLQEEQQLSDIDYHIVMDEMQDKDTQSEDAVTEVMSEVPEKWQSNSSANVIVIAQPQNFINSAE